MHTPEKGDRDRGADSMEISFPRIGWGSETTSQYNQRVRDRLAKPSGNTSGSHKEAGSAGDDKELSTVPDTATPDSTRIRSVFMRGPSD